MAPKSTSKKGRAPGNKDAEPGNSLSKTHLQTWNSLLAEAIGMNVQVDEEITGIQEKIIRQSKMTGSRAVIDNLVATALDTVEKTLQQPAAERMFLVQDLVRQLEMIQELAELQEPPAQGVDEWAQALGVPQGASSELSGVEKEEADVLDPALAVNFIPDFIQETSERMEAVEADLLALEADPGNEEKLHALLRAFHSTKGTAVFLGLMSIKRLAHQAENVLTQVRDGQLVLNRQVTDVILEAADTLKSMAKALQAYVETQSIPAVADNYHSLMDRLAAMAVLEDAGARPFQPEPEKEESGEPLPEKKGRSQPSAAPMEGTIRVATRKMDQLINLVGQLVISHSIINQAEEEGRNSARDVAQMGKIIRSLQDLSMSLRMVPMKSTFQKMERIARDLGRASNKSLRFIGTGEETEIDRNMVESLSDPLVHLIRNAVDHGLENEPERHSLGKSPEGTITLTAYHAAGNVVIEVGDDGRGLDREKIISRAVSLGMAHADRVYQDHEVQQMVFLPGFSTAREVTEVSGRGVGLDVVRKNVEALRGRIHVQTTPGRGSVFTLRIPLTLAIIDGLLLRVGGSQYIIPTLAVEHVFAPRPEQLSLVQGKGETVMFQNHLLPVFRLSRLFGLPGEVCPLTRSLLLVAEYENTFCALVIDELLGQQQVVIKTLGEDLGSIPGIAGAAILGDGKIRFILDVAGIVQLAHGQKTAPVG